MRQKISVIPEGGYYQTDPDLGYSLKEGRFRVILEDGYEFTTTHDSDLHRITGRSADDALKRPEIWIFGCSFTHGWSLNDYETYPWQVQLRMPQYKIVNFGVGGYGTVHSLIQFRRALAKGRAKPRIAVIAYAAFHEYRNTFLRVWRKKVFEGNLLGPLKQPYARIDSGGGLKIEMADVEYEPFPLMEHSALIHLVEDSYNKIEDYLLPQSSFDVTKALMAEFASEADKNGIKLVVVSVMGNQASDDMLAYARTLGVTAGDISADLTNPGYVNLPHDTHPNARANIVNADKLVELLEEDGLAKN